MRPLQGLGRQLRMSRAAEAAPGGRPVVQTVVGLGGWDVWKRQTVKGTPIFEGVLPGSSKLFSLFFGGGGIKPWSQSFGGVFFILDLPILCVKCVPKFT